MVNFNKICQAAALALALSASAQAQTAGTIIGATSVTTTMGEISSTNGPITRVINESGLSATYTSGETDYSTFTSTATHVGIQDGTKSWFSALNNKTGNVVFNFGTTVVIDSFALWNLHKSNTNSVQGFSLYDDEDNLIGSFSAVKGPGSDSNIINVQVFDFTSAVETTYVRMSITSNWGGALTGFGEAAFQAGTPISAVPEPSTWALFMAGAGLMGAAARRRRVAAKAA